MRIDKNWALRHHPEDNLAMPLAQQNRSE